MAVLTTKAHLIEPHATFCTDSMHSGVWKRKTIISCWNGKVVRLKADAEPARTSVCNIIRVGDEFFVAANFFEDAKKKLQEYERFTGEKLLPVRPKRETEFEKLERIERLNAAQPKLEALRRQSAIA